MSDVPQHQRRSSDLHSQVNMDYSLTNALSYNMDGIKRVSLFYDVNCSYMRKLYERTIQNKFIDIPKEIEITPGIGIWHVRGHQARCFPRYAPLYIPGVGWIDGEIIETLWSILNIISTSTRTMTAPHRQELLDFQMNDSNFMKMIRMGLDLLSRDSLKYSLKITGKALRSKYETAQTGLKSAATTFAKIDDEVPNELREIWFDDERSAYNQRVNDPSAMDIFQVKTTKGVYFCQRLHCLLEKDNRFTSPDSADDQVRSPFSKETWAFRLAWCGHMALPRASY